MPCALEKGLSTQVIRHIAGDALLVISATELRIVRRIVQLPLYRLLYIGPAARDGRRIVVVDQHTAVLELRPGAEIARAVFSETLVPILTPSRGERLVVAGTEGKHTHQGHACGNHYRANHPFHLHQKLIVQVPI